MKTYQFVTSMVINFFYTIIIEEPLKVFWFAFFIAYQRKPNWDQDHLDIDEKLPTIYDDPETQKRKNKAKAEVPEFDPEDLEPVRFRRIQEGEMNVVIQDILVYLAYLSIVIIV